MLWALLSLLDGLRAGGPPKSSVCGGQETPGSAAAAVPPAWPSPACPRLIPLLQTLSLTPADKSHFQDGLIQFSTDFLPGPVTYGSPAGAGLHVTPQRPPSLEQLSTGCCSLISPGQHGRGPHPALPPLHELPAPAFPPGCGPGNVGVVGYLGLWQLVPKVVPRDAGGGTWGCFWCSQ